jgi:hypothetical protein
VRYEQNRFQLEEVSLERDQLQNQNKATVDKAQNAINEISQKLQDSIAENQNLSEAINNLKNNGELNSCYNIYFCCDLREYATLI